MAKGIIDLYYVPIVEMAADGLTKPLTAEKHAEFVRILRIETINISSIKKVRAWEVRKKQTDIL